MNCYKCATPLPDHSKFCLACGADVSGEGHTHATVDTEVDSELLNALKTELGDDFTVERELGRGGMAIVFLGRDKHLGRKVAIKLLPPMLTFGSPGLIERFKREARTAATLDHPNIIPVYRVSTGGKLFWYVMKYLEGESLDVLLKREGTLSIERTVEIVREAADALDYAHQNKVVHRDVKPANIMLDRRGRVTVSDFGIAKALDVTALTNSGATIGTPHYMSPEQCVGTGISGASDQYSLAVTAYQMLSGHLPFSADSMLELMRLHTQDPPPPLGTLRAGLPPALVAAVEKGLAKAPEDRFATCSDLAREMARAAQEASDVERRRVSAAARPTADEPALKPGAGARPQAPRKAEPRAGASAQPKPSVLVTAITSTGQRIVKHVGKGVSIAVGVALLAIASLTLIDWALSTKRTTPGPAGNATRTVAGNTTTAAPAAARDTTPPRSESTRVVASAPPEPQKDTAPARDAAASRQNNVKQAGNRPAANAVPPAPATITVASRPLSAIIINGVPAQTNPVRNLQVPAGRVAIRFQVTDSTGVWMVDTVVTVAPGEQRNLGRIQLRRP